MSIKFILPNEGDEGEEKAPTKWRLYFKRFTVSSGHKIFLMGENLETGTRRYLCRLSERDETIAIASRYSSSDVFDINQQIEE